MPFVSRPGSNSRLRKVRGGPRAKGKGGAEGPLFAEIWRSGVAMPRVLIVTDFGLVIQGLHRLHPWPLTFAPLGLSSRAAISRGLHRVRPVTPFLADIGRPDRMRFDAGVRANYEKNEHDEKTGVCFAFFSSCSRCGSQHYALKYFRATEHDEKRVRCFSSCSGVFTVALAAENWYRSLQTAPPRGGSIWTAFLERPARSVLAADALSLRRRFRLV